MKDMDDRFSAILDTKSAQYVEKLFKQLIDRAREHFTSTVDLVVDDAVALQGRAPNGRGHACASLNDDGTATVFIAWKLIAPLQTSIAHRSQRALRERQEGILMHELAHVALLQAGNEEHSERDADDFAEVLWGKRIAYDNEDVQTTGPGTSPRPVRLDARANPGGAACPSCVLTNPRRRRETRMHDVDPHTPLPMCECRRCKAARREDDEQGQRLRHMRDQRQRVERGEPIENPGEWTMKRIYALFGLEGDRIPPEMRDERMYKGVKIVLRSSDEVKAGRGQKGAKTLHRIVAHCGCGKVIGFGRMEQHAKVCDWARMTMGEKDLCNCDECARRQLDTSKYECPYICRCGKHLVSVHGPEGIVWMSNEYGGGLVRRCRRTDGDHEPRFPVDANGFPSGPAPLWTEEELLALPVGEFKIGGLNGEDRTIYKEDDGNFYTRPNKQGFTGSAKTFEGSAKVWRNNPSSTDTLSAIVEYGVAGDFNDIYDGDAEEMLQQGEVRYGRKVTWVGTTDKMIKVDPDYVRCIEGNTFFPEKLGAVAEAVRDSTANTEDGKPVFYVGYGTVRLIDKDIVEEDQQYFDDNGVPPDRPLDERDIGKLLYTMRDGNHRVFGALIGGEKHVWMNLADNQLQDVNEWRKDKRGFKTKRGAAYAKLMKLLDEKLKSD